jgi:glucose-1-phosphate adenylyltransferase
MKGMHGIIFSYEKKTELATLTEQRIYGSVPFGGDYRVVDFMLSNMVNAGITDVGVIMHGKCQSMLDHLGTGKHWDLSRKYGGLKLLPAFAYQENRESGGQFRGKLEALGCVMDYLRHIRQDYVVLCDSDIVTNIPLKDVLDSHIESGADITCVCSSQPGRPADTYFTLDITGRIVDTVYDVNTPAGYQSLNIFIMSRELLLELVSDAMAHNRYGWRRHILQDKCGELNMRGYVWDSFAARIDTVQDYYNRSMELLRPEIRAELFCPQRPVYAKENDAASTYIDPTVECVNSLISDGCDVQGSVRNSILFRGVKVEKGATVVNSILFKNTVVKAGAMVRNVIADKNVVFSENTSMMGHEQYPVVVAKNTAL